MTTFQKLSAAFPSLTNRQVQLLVDGGFVRRDDVEDVIRSHPEGARLIGEYLGVSSRQLLSAFGWREFPAHSAVTLSGPCTVGGVLAPATAVAPPNRRQQVCVQADDLPDHVSLLDRYGPARDQGPVGACTAFGTVALLEGLFGDASIDFAEAFVYSLTKARDGENGDGSWQRISTEVILEHGACFEATHPYRADRGYLRRRPCEAAFTEARKHRVADRMMLDATDARIICEHIAAGRPVAISVPIFGSTYYSARFHTEGTFLMPLGPVDSCVGGHAMCAAGFVTDAWLIAHNLPAQPGGGAFLVRNSWGRWATENPIARLLGADHGYATIPFAYMQYGWESITALLPVGAERVRFGQRLIDSALATAGHWLRHTSDRYVTRSHQRLMQALSAGPQPPRDE